MELFTASTPTYSVNCKAFLESLLDEPRDTPQYFHNLDSHAPKSAWAFERKSSSALLRVKWDANLLTGCDIYRCEAIDLNDISHKGMCSAPIRERSCE